MLLRISLASLDGPLGELELGGGDRTDAVVVDNGMLRPSRTPFDPCWSWGCGFARRLRSLCSAGSILPFTSRLESAWVRRGESAARSVGCARRELDVRGGTAAGMFRLRSPLALYGLGESAGEATATGTGEAMAARELIGELGSVCVALLALDLREGRREDDVGDAPEECWLA